MPAYPRIAGVAGETIWVAMLRKEDHDEISSFVGQFNIFEPSSTTQLPPAAAASN